MRPILIYIAIGLVLTATGGSFGQNERPVSPIIARSDRVTVAEKNSAMQKALESGNFQYARGEYDAAIAIYDAAVRSDPAHIAVPTLLTNKILAQINRGIALFNSGLASGDNKTRDLGKSYFRAAAEESTRAITLARNLDYPAGRMYLLLSARKDAMHLFASRVDLNSTVDAILATLEYLAVETVWSRAEKAHIELGELLVASGNTERGRLEFEYVISNSPRNPDALFGLGEALFNLAGEKNNDKGLFQKSANNFRAYLNSARPDHPRRQDAVNFLSEITNKHGVVPK